VPDSYILNKVNFQQKKKDRKKKKEIQLQIELHQNVKRIEIEQHPKCEKKRLKRNCTLPKNPTCVLSSVVCLKYKNAYIM